MYAKLIYVSCDLYEIICIRLVIIVNRWWKFSSLLQFWFCKFVGGSNSGLTWIVIDIFFVGFWWVKYVSYILPEISANFGGVDTFDGFTIAVWGWSDDIYILGKSRSGVREAIVLFFYLLVPFVSLIQLKRYEASNIIQIVYILSELKKHLHR